MGDEAVPVFSGGYAEEIFVLLDPFKGDAEDESGKACVGDEEVAASAEREKWQAALASKVDGFEDFSFRRGFCEPACGTSDFEGGIGGERNVFAEFHR